MKLSLIFQKYRLIVFISMLLIIGFLATSLANYFILKSSIKKDIFSNQLPLTSNNIYSEIQKDLLTPISVSSVMAHDTFLKDWVLTGEKDLPKITNYLKEIKDRYNAITSFFVSEQTRIYYHFKGILKKVRKEEPRDKWYFRVRAMEQPYETNIDTDMGNRDAITIFINYKVFDSNGNFIGAIGIGLLSNTVGKLIQRYQKEYNRRVYFVDRSGTVILSGKDSLSSGLNIRNDTALQDIADNILRTDLESFEYKRDADTVLLNVRFIPELNWYVFVEQVEEEATVQLRNTLLNDFAVSLAIMCIILFVTTYTIRTFQNKVEERTEELADFLRKLKESESDYRNIVQNVNSIILRMTPEGNVKFLNKFAEKFFGFSAGEITGKNVVGSIVPEKDGAGKNLRTLMQDIGKNPGKYVYNENENVLRNGKRVWISWTNQGVAGIDGNTREILCVGHDITHRKKKEDMLKKAKRTAEEATKLKDKFVSLVSHDLRAPLKSALELLGWSDIGKKENIQKIDSIDATQKVKNILEGLWRMIDKLLDLSLLQTGKIEPVKRFVDIRTLVEMEIDKLSHPALKKEIEVINKLPEDIQIFTDPVLTGEVIQNLLSNAIKFCGRANKIIFSMPAKNPVTILVKDDGRGIKQSMIKDIFKHAIKTTSIGTAGESGTGIGLPYCKDIMEAHEGTITVESIEGKETSFFLCFPEQKPLVLIADDQKIQREILKDHLKIIRKVEILEVENGKELIEVLDEVTPDLIITDVNMPVMDGCQAVKAIREYEKEKGGHVPIIALTSESNLKNRQECLKDGVDECLSKPVNTDNLMQIVDKLLGTSYKKHPNLIEKPESGIWNKEKLFNIEPLRKKLGYNENKLNEMLHWILEDTEHQIEQIDQAVHEGLNKQVIFAAHRAKNSAVQIEASKLTDIFSIIEQLGEEGNLGIVPEQIEKAKKNFDDIKYYIKQNNVN